MARISKNELIRLQKKYHTDARIGQEFGITRQAVHQLRKKYTIESRTAGNPDRNKEMVAMRTAGKSVEAIAKKFKLSIPQTYRILKETGPKKPVKKAAKKVVKKAAKRPVKKTAKKAMKKVAKKAAVKKSTVNKAPAKKKVVKKTAAKKKGKKK
ncbi:MAG: hypothetical protein JW863_15370 [Chitinispirillaceae bacterium]|nr:hypothetical protein [Chitinispirillaceae bacterium]